MIPSSAEMRPLPIWVGILLSVCSGLLLAFSFVPFDWGGCVWIGLIPLLSALWCGGRRDTKKTARLSFFYGWLCGVVFYGVSLWWINEVSTLGYIPLILFYGGLFPGVWGLLIGVLFRPKRSAYPEATMPAGERRQAWKQWAYRDMIPSAIAALAGASLWVCLDWVRGWLIPGFGWNGLGVALYGNPMAQWAEWIGTPSLSFIPVLFSCWLWRAASRAGIMVMKEGKRTVPWDFMALVIVLLAMFCFGVFQSAFYSSHSSVVTGEGRDMLPVMTVQLNLSQEEKWNPANTTEVYRLLLNETEQGLEQIRNRAVQQASENKSVVSLEMPAWVIWPESSFPRSTFYNKTTRELFPEQANVQFLSAEEDYIQALRRDICPFILLMGTDEVYLSDIGKIEEAYNCLGIFEGDYRNAQLHAKAQLVPFGEYIPFRKSLPILEKAFEASAGMAMGINYTPGESCDPIQVSIRPGSSKKVGVIPLVCFEDVVGSWVRRFVRPESQVLVNVTNDGWFRTSFANEQHWRNASFRCIELRRSMIRAANTGVSVALAPNGSVIKDLRDAQGSPFLRGTMDVSVPVGYKTITLYAFLGDWFVLLCLLIAFSLILVDYFKLRYPPLPQRAESRKFHNQSQLRCANFSNKRAAKVSKPSHGVTITSEGLS